MPTPTTLTGNGLATPPIPGDMTRLTVSGVLFQRDRRGGYREVRLLSAADHQAQALEVALQQVARYAAWSRSLTLWQERLAVPALPEPAADQPHIQVLAPLDDPWS